jgi:transposase InsO family protein
MRRCSRRPIETPVAANQRWSLDFVSDQISDGRRFRILAVVDDCTRECLGLVADTSISGLRVARELDNIIRQRGRRPDTIVSETQFGGAITARSTRRTPSCSGRTGPASAGITSRLASPNRTAS